MTTFKNFILNEGINDAGIFKAIFIIGVPGAGKSYTISRLHGKIAPVIVNTDRAAEFLAKKTGSTASSKSGQVFWDKTKRLTEGVLFNYLNSMLPLFVDGTSNDTSHLLHRIGILEALGYDVGVINVVTPLDTALQRVKERADLINREVDEDFVREVFNRSTETADYLRGKMQYFKEVNNSDGELTDELMLKLFKSVQGFFNEPVNNPLGKRAIATLKEEGKKYLVPAVLTSPILRKKVSGWYK